VNGRIRSLHRTLAPAAADPGDPGAAGSTGPLPWRLRSLPVCASTESELERWLAAEAPEGGDGLAWPRAVVARQQRFGHGQQGRRWVSPPGGVWLSAALPWPVDPAGAAAPGLAVAVGLAQELRQRGVPVRLKWPNDLVLQTAAGPRKLAGLLPGLRLRSGRVRWARIGVGLNGRNRVPAGATGLRSFRGVWSGEPLALTALVLAGLERAMALAIDPEGVRLRAETLLEPGGPLWLEGEWWQPQGLAPDGSLLLAHADGRERNLRRF
jgi:BirA family biotin operon repressor/biotin-[acetyl-CoA-carboxylase] ligase